MIRTLGEPLSMPLSVGPVVANRQPILALAVPPVIRHSDESACGAGAIGAQRRPRRLSASRCPIREKLRVIRANMRLSDSARGSAKTWQSTDSAAPGPYSRPSANRVVARLVDFRDLL